MKIISVLQTAFRFKKGSRSVFSATEEELTEEEAFARCEMSLQDFFLNVRIDYHQCSANILIKFISCLFLWRQLFFNKQNVQLRLGLLP